MPTTLEPNSTAELAQMLADADRQGLAVTPRGGGTKPEWGNPATRSDVVLSTARLNQVIEHAWGDMTATVQSGCTVTNLQNTLAQHGQRLALDPLWPDRATIGGILATNDSGSLRLRYGGLRDLIIGMTIALPDGTVAMSGGKVVKNVAGYDLPKLMTGALGTLGVITQAVFRLYPLPKHSRSLTLAPPNLMETQRLLLALQNSQLAHTSLQLRVARGVSSVLDILIEGTEQGIVAQESQIQTMCAAVPGSVQIHASDPDVWSAREQLWTVSQPIAKISILPTQIIQTIANINNAAHSEWSAVIQASGIGCVRMASTDLTYWTDLRDAIETTGGSLVMLKPIPNFDAWGNIRDTALLMRAVKQQFDPKGTLNPGRYAGGI